MARVVIFHHIRGLTPGVRQLARELRDLGHTVHVPDLFDGALPAGIDAGQELVTGLGEPELLRRATGCVDALPAPLVQLGISWGVMFAQRFAQQRPGTRAAVLLEGFVDPAAEWSFGPWPPGVPLQVHGMDRDPYFAGEGDLAAARAFADGPGSGLAEVFTYPGSAHLFTDASLPTHHPLAHRLLMTRVAGFLARLDGAGPATG